MFPEQNDSRVLQRLVGRARKKVVDRVLKRLRSSALEVISRSDVECAYDDAAKGNTEFDLLTILQHGSDLCQKCGNCCRRCSPILLCPEDIDRLGNVLGTDRLLRYVSFVDSEWYFKKTNPCAFLRENRCVIYEFRPLVCRSFPIIQKDGLLVLGRFGYCKVPENLLVVKTTGLIVQRLMKKQEPLLYARRNEAVEAVLVRFESFESQESRFLFARDLLRMLEPKQKDKCMT